MRAERILEPRGFTRLGLALGVGLAVVVVGVSIGRAVIPGTNGVISACYDFEGRGKGKVRVIDEDAGESCKQTEKPLEWFSVLGSNSRFLSSTLVQRQVSGQGIEIHTLQPCGPNQDCKLTAFCVTGQAVNGGFWNIDAGTHLIASVPWEGGDDAWEVRWRNNQTVDTVTVIVTCSV